MPPCATCAITRVASEAETTSVTARGPPPAVAVSTPASVARSRTRAHGIEPRERRANRRSPERVDASLVHDARVQVGDLLLGRTGAASGCAREVFDDRAQVGLGAIGEFREGAVGGAIGRDVGAGEPAPVRETEQVVLRPDGAIDRVEVEARRRRRRLSGGERGGQQDGQRGGANGHGRLIG